MRLLFRRQFFRGFFIFLATVGGGGGAHINYEPPSRGGPAVFLFSALGATSCHVTQKAGTKWARSIELLRGSKERMTQFSGRMMNILKGRDSVNPNLCMTRAFETAPRIEFFFSFHDLTQSLSVFRTAMFSFFASADRTAYFHPRSRLKPPCFRKTPYEPPNVAKFLLIKIFTFEKSYR